MLWIGDKTYVVDDEVAEQIEQLDEAKKQLVWVLKRIIDRCRRCPAEQTSIRILALIKKWSSPTGKGLSK